MQRVLIIDDEQMMVQLLTTVLEMDGYDVASASDPETVVSSLKAGIPEIVVIDYNLKSGGGLDIVRWMRTKRRLRHIPIIVASGMEREDEALAAGANRFLLKPFDISELSDTIRDLLQPAHS